MNLQVMVIVMVMTMIVTVVVMIPLLASIAPGDAEGLLTLTSFPRPGTRSSNAWESTPAASGAGESFD